MSLDASLAQYNLRFVDLLSPSGLARVDAQFQQYLRREDHQHQTECHAALCALREGVLPAHHSALALDLAPTLESFLASCFGLSDAVAQTKAACVAQDPVWFFQAVVMQKDLRSYLKNNAPSTDFKIIHEWLMAQDGLAGAPDLEVAVATWAQAIREDPLMQDTYHRLLAWCATAQATDAGRALTAGWQSFRQPQKQDFAQLVSAEIEDDLRGDLTAPPSRLTAREGFDYHSTQMSEKEAQAQTHYCVLCHTRETDYCSTGFRIKKNDASYGVRTNPLGKKLTGCPLDEKISEMHQLKRAGLNIAALAMAMVDNPLIPLTGHRICNDCMLACIYQKQQPVDIPQVETRVLADVLALPYGAEVYYLLSRWNPLRQQQYQPLQDNAYRVLVMGMGPAGLAMAHHLTQAGVTVVAMDGLKLEPVDAKAWQQPIKDYAAWCAPLSQRSVSGLGGVAEYGITSRWDKNRLKLIQLTLYRRDNFLAIGSVRYGGRLTVEQAWEKGFDHLTMAVGAGLPQALPMPGSLAPGMYMANTFLMQLHLHGLALESTQNTFSLQMPILVIGGGLTAVDTACEAQAFYLTLIQRIARRYDELAALWGEVNLRTQLGDAALAPIDVWRAHAQELNDLKNKKESDYSALLIKLLWKWGGVTIVYRRGMSESPAYRTYAGELQAALDQGVRYSADWQPQRVLLGDDGRVDALLCQARVQDETGESVVSDETCVLPAKSILVATGASPNIAYEYEHRGTFARESGFYQAWDVQKGCAQPASQACEDPKNCSVFTSYESEVGQRVSFIGDLHPAYAGSVVKALASARDHYADILTQLNTQTPQNKPDKQTFLQSIKDEFKSINLGIERLSERWSRIRVQSPAARVMWSPGQLYRLQTLADRAGSESAATQQTTGAMALMGIPDPCDADVLNFIFDHQSIDGVILSKLPAGASVSLMGPTGARSKAPNAGQKVLLIGGASALIYALSWQSVWREFEVDVAYISTQMDSKDMFLISELKSVFKSIDYLNSSVCEAPSAADWPDGDLSACLKQARFPWLLTDCTQVMLIDHPCWAPRLQACRDLFAESVQINAAVYGSMQCMLKGVCAQCLQWQCETSPEDGSRVRTKAVYGCSWQHQPIDMVDWDFLSQRAGNHAACERLTALWFAREEG